MKDLVFELSVPAAPAFRNLAAPAASKYGEALGLAGDEARALEASLREALDLAAGAAAGADVTIVVERSGDRLDLTVKSGGRSSTLSRQLAAAKSQ